MSYDIVESERPGILRVAYLGEVGERVWRHALTECIERIRAGKVFGVLFDFRGSGEPMSITEHYDYLEAMSAATLLIGKRFAFLHVEEDPELWRFIETVALNRGLDARAFSDENVALDWLGAAARRAAKGRDE